MNEQKIKLTNKHIKYHIVKWTNDNTLFWIKYAYELGTYEKMN